jgi:hypothetical protein
VDARHWLASVVATLQNWKKKNPHKIQNHPCLYTDRVQKSGRTAPHHQKPQKKKKKKKKKKWLGGGGAKNAARETVTCV